MINLFQPNLGQEELAAVKSVFESNWIGKGKKVSQFEEKFAQSLNTKKEHFLSTTSCTEAIFLSSKIFGFNSEDEVIVPSVSFPSIGSAVKESGARLVLCDVDKRSLNVRACDIEKVITEKTKAVFITHYGGVPCEMEEILAVCKKNNIYIIEDAACAVQSFYKGQACGTFGDMAMWSFDAMKTLTTGDGAMIYIKDLEHRKVAQELLYLGLPSKEKSGLDSSDSKSMGWWEFGMNEYGRRAIMNDITASIGIEQLKKLSGFLKTRRDTHKFYEENLTNIGDLILPNFNEAEMQSSYYFYWIQTNSRDELAKYLLDNGIYSTFRYWPLHKVDLFSDGEVYPNSELVASNTLNIPIHHNLSYEDKEKIVNTIISFFDNK
ncbi:DegT/DnrJ/EryC1/StrS family aminotransferase [Vibrio splendidus]|uniref:DegT/DnrJ/EryC1/StrS family aminotransferase n=1 Tax=Vibrio splendidus TaxID=29497 RepID=UPI000C825262|nr:DegT/DnrJ/EryC1/StrS family aminotransferase [Vibrio splendidus]PMG18840.1 hypothetical protein BCU95_22990 [Vibrio splendidus]